MFITCKHPFQAHLYVTKCGMVFSDHTGSFREVCPVSRPHSRYKYYRVDQEYHAEHYVFANTIGWKHKEDMCFPYMNDVRLIPNEKGYQIFASRLGEIWYRRTIIEGNELTDEVTHDVKLPLHSSRGYKKFAMPGRGGRRMDVHKAVALAWHWPHKELKASGERLVVDHINENPSDNRPENLRWCLDRDFLLSDGTIIEGNLSKMVRSREYKNAKTPPFCLLSEKLEYDYVSATKNKVASHPRPVTYKGTARGHAHLNRRTGADHHNVKHTQEQLDLMAELHSWGLYQAKMIHQHFDITQKAFDDYLKGMKSRVPKKGSGVFNPALHIPELLTEKQQKCLKLKQLDAKGFSGTAREAAETVDLSVDQVRDFRRGKFCKEVMDTLP